MMVMTFCYVRKGKVVDLEESQNEMTSSGTIGLVIRVKTHGVPNDVNSHPHLSNSRI
jgi:glucosamine--fructose-6-phosphate aminotransferase (isomerizing)